MIEEQPIFEKTKKNIDAEEEFRVRLPRDRYKNSVVS